MAMRPTKLVTLNNLYKLWMMINYPLIILHISRMKVERVMEIHLQMKIKIKTLFCKIFLILVLQKIM